MTSAVVFGVLIGLFAQASDDERLKKVEEKVQQQQEIDQLKKKPADGGVSASASERVEDVGLVLTGQTNELTSYSFGVNWWLTRNLRVSADLVQERFHQPINFGGGRSDDILNGFLARFQIDF